MDLFVPILIKYACKIMLNYPTVVIIWGPEWIQFVINFVHAHAEASCANNLTKFERSSCAIKLIKTLLVSIISVIVSGTSVFYSDWLFFHNTWEQNPQNDDKKYFLFIYFFS